MRCKGGESEADIRKAVHRRRARAPSREQVHEPRRGRRHADGAARNGRARRSALPTNLPEGASFDAIFGGAQTATPATLHLLLGLVALLFAVIAWSSARRTLPRLRRRTLTCNTTADRGGPFGPPDPSAELDARRRRRASRFASRGPSLPPSAVARDGARRGAAGRSKWIAARALALGLALTGNAVYIHAKALLAQVLLHRAWAHDASDRRAGQALAVGGHDAGRAAHRARRRTSTSSCSPARPAARSRSVPGITTAPRFPASPGNAVHLRASRHALPLPRATSRSATR